MIVGNTETPLATMRLDHAMPVNTVWQAADLERPAKITGGNIITPAVYKALINNDVAVNNFTRALTYTFHWKFDAVKQKGDNATIDDIAKFLSTLKFAVNGPHMQAMRPLLNLLNAKGPEIAGVILRSIAHAILRNSENRYRVDKPEGKWQLAERVLIGLKARVDAK